MRREQDYLLRMIAELIYALQLVMKLTRTKEYASALRIVDEQLTRLLGVPSDRIGELTSAELLARVGFNVPPETARQQRGALAGLLAEAGKMYGALRNDEQAYHCTVAALELALAVYADPDEPPEGTPEIAPLVAVAGPSSLPVYVQLQLLEYYERTGAYAAVEDTYFRLRDAESAPEITELGRELFDRMLALDDETLARGGLTRAEVEAALAELDL